MALDAQLAQRLWNERYSDELEHYARKNAYLNDFKDPEDLFQDMVIGVWMKAVNAFEAGKVTYTADLERSFNAFFTRILNQYLASLKEHRETGKQQWDKKLRRLDKPLGNDEGDEGATLLDTLADADVDPDLREDLSRIMRALPENLEAPLQYIIENLERGNSSTIMDEIRAKGDAGDVNFQDPATRKGWTKTRLLNSLMEEPEFVEFILAY